MTTNVNIGGIYVLGSVSTGNHPTSTLSSNPWGQTTNVSANTIDTASKTTYWYWDEFNANVDAAPNTSFPTTFQYIYTSASAFTAKIRILTDDNCTFKLNGVTITSTATGWSGEDGYSGTLNIVNGTNTFVFSCTNAGTNRGAAGFACYCYNSSGGALLFNTNDTAAGWSLIPTGLYYYNGIPIKTFFTLSDGNTSQTSGYNMINTKGGSFTKYTIPFYDTPLPVLLNSGSSIFSNTLNGETTKGTVARTVQLSSTGQILVPDWCNGVKIYITGTIGDTGEKGPTGPVVGGGAGEKGSSGGFNGSGIATCRYTNTGQSKNPEYKHSPGKPGEGGDGGDGGDGGPGGPGGDGGDGGDGGVNVLNSTYRFTPNTVNNISVNINSDITASMTNKSSENMFQLVVTKGRKGNPGNTGNPGGPGGKGGRGIAGKNANTCKYGNRAELKNQNDGYDGTNGTKGDKGAKGAANTQPGAKGNKGNKGLSSHVTNSRSSSEISYINGALSNVSVYFFYIP